MQVGSMVMALAGKEKGQTFIVVRLDDRFAYLADGKRLKADKPKKKSLKHIKFHGKELTLTENELLEEKVNAKIRKFLKRSEHVEGRCN